MGLFRGNMRYPRCNIQNILDEGFYCQCIGCESIADGGRCIIVQEEEGVYRYDGDTPHGGSVAYLYFTDSAGNILPKEKATYVEIRELDDGGHILHVEFGIVDDRGFTIKKHV